MSDWKADPASWLSSVDAGGKVGAKHHVVPRFLLKRWASSVDQLQVYSRADERFSRRAIADVAVRDFYTFIDLDKESNSTLEELLAKIEADAAPVISWLANDFRRPSACLSTDQRDALDIFVAFQAVRGPRSRREIEALGDHWAKSMVEGQIPDSELARLEFSPHQNDHIAYMTEAMHRVAESLYLRPVYVVRLDRPSLWISDEPVVVEHDGSESEQHHPDCAMTASELRRRQAAARRAGGECSIVRHVRPARRRGFLDASAVALPISPRFALVYGPSGLRRDLAVASRPLSGAEAERFAAELNKEVAMAALDVIVGFHGDDSFRAQPMPEPAPIIHICGTHGIADQALNSVPRRVRPNRYTNEV